MMILRRAAPVALIFASVSLIPAATAAPAAAETPGNTHLTGLDAGEAAALLERLRRAQQSLKDGKPDFFELSSGSFATYAMASRSPRDAFVNLDLAKPWSIERLANPNSLHHLYRIAVFPDGLGHPYWQVDIDLSIGGEVNRVALFYKAPAPF